jgi:hypothetical protein
MAKRFTRPSAHFLFLLSKLVERTSAHAQGKGYGTATIKQEVNLVHRVLGNLLGLQLILAEISAITRQNF